MTDSLVVAGRTVAHGERVAFIADAPIGNESVRVPVVVLRGDTNGPRVTVTAGIHGAEYVGIEAARRLAMELDPTEIVGTLVVVPIANTTAFHRRTIYVSGLDSNNLNRSFPGDGADTRTHALAAWLFKEIIAPSDYYIDLHGGDMIEALAPFVIYLGTEDRAVEEASRAMAVATGIPRLIRSLTPGSTYAAASAAGIPAILSEIGGQGVWSEELVGDHLQATRRVLRHLGLLPGGAPTHVAEGRQYDTFAWFRSEHDGLFHPEVTVGEWVRNGQTLGRVTDYFGTLLQHVEAHLDGEVVFLVTSLAINDGDPLLALGA